MAKLGKAGECSPNGIYAITVSEPLHYVAGVLWTVFPGQAARPSAGTGRPAPGSVTLPVTLTDASLLRQPDATGPTQSIVAPPATPVALSASEKMFGASITRLVHGLLFYHSTERR